MKNFRLLSGPPLVFRFLSPGSSHAAYVRRLRKIFIDNFQLGSMTNRVLTLAQPVGQEIEREGLEAAQQHDEEVGKFVQRIVDRWNVVAQELK